MIRSECRSFKSFVEADKRVFISRTMQITRRWWCLSVAILVAWSFNGIAARSRLCTDDRIVFPKDDPDENQNAEWNAVYNYTTAESLQSNSNETDELVWDLTTTELPNIDNRILVETLPRCKPGFQLRANRCRKSA